MECVLSDQAIGVEGKTIDRIKKCEYWAVAPHLKSLCLNEHQLFQKAEVGGIKFYGLPTNYMSNDVSQIRREQARQQTAFHQYIIQSRSTNNAPTIDLISSGSEGNNNRNAIILPDSSENSNENLGTDEEEANDLSDDDDQVATPRLNALARQNMPQNEQQSHSQLAQTEFASQLPGSSGDRNDAHAPMPMLTVSQSTIPLSNSSEYFPITQDAQPISEMDIDRLVTQNEMFLQQESTGLRHDISPVNIPPTDTQDQQFSE